MISSLWHNHRTIDGGDWLDTLMFREVYPDLSGKQIYFSGKFFHDRKLIGSTIAAVLGFISNNYIGANFTRKTDFLVCGESYGPLKVKKAMQWGTPIVDDFVFWTHPQIVDALKQLDLQQPYPLPDLS